MFLAGLEGNPATTASPDRTPLDSGERRDAFDWYNDVVYFRFRPHWMTAYAPDVATLIAR